MQGWAQSTSEAKAIQERLRASVIRRNQLGEVAVVAGVDVAVDRESGRARAAAVALSTRDLELLESAVVVRPLSFPYVPGYLSFRELPAAIGALERLGVTPDAVLCDGHGIAHPRRFGLASHLGVELDVPTVGVGKSRLIGRHGPVPRGRGEWTSLLAADETGEDEVIGAVLRSRRGVNPIFVSIGHRVSLSSAIGLVMACTGRFRLPETTRAADRLAAWR